MTDKIYETNIKLCAAVKKYKYLHKAYNNNNDPECKNAWRLVANECNATVEFCQKRWNTMRRCFFEGLRNPENKYYFHDHLNFLQEGYNEPNSVTTYREKTNSNDSESLQRSHRDSLRLQESDVNLYDNRNTDSVCRQAISTDKLKKVMQKNNQARVCDMDEIEEEALETNENHLVHKRALKRPLDTELIDKLIEEEPKEKHSRKNNAHNLMTELPTKSIKVRLKKLDVNKTETNRESVKAKMVDCFTQSDLKQTRDFGTQSECNPPELDDSFIKTMTTQLNEMNARQKMNFKRKMYQSLFEVLDDATQFPNSNETLTLTDKQAPFIADTTVGEIRLIRELVSLLQAAKSTPEIMDATETAKTFTPVQSKSPSKMDLQVVEDLSKPKTPSISLSLSDDEDLQFFIDNLNDKDDTPLPRSLDELKAKPAEATKVPSKDNVVGLPHRVIHKVVTISGPSVSTKVTRDGEKLRIYGAFPKLVDPNRTQRPLTKHGISSGSFLESYTKNLQLTGRNKCAGTLFVPSTKTQQDTAKVSNSESINKNIRSLNNKPTNNMNQLAGLMNISSQPTSSSGTNCVITSPTSSKSLQPENIILCPATGNFQTVATVNTATPPSVPSTGVTTNSIQPSTSNASPHLMQAVRLRSQVMPKHYRISDDSSAEDRNIYSTALNFEYSIPQMQISQPRSLNTKPINNPISPNLRNAVLPINSKTTETSTTPAGDIKFPIDTLISTITSNQFSQIPILPTAGTVQADNLDHLLISPPEIKTEP